MLKILFSVLVLPIVLFSGGIARQMPKDVMLQGFNDGKEIVMTQKDVEKIDGLLFEALDGCLPKPALGVSLHDETVEAVSHGLWLRFAFDKTLEVDGMPFDQLLLNVTQDMYGFNLIRGNHGKFEGRCFYVDLRRNMDELFDFLQNLETSDKPFEAQVQNFENNFGGKLILGAIRHGIGPHKARHLMSLSQLDLPAVNKDKENQNTVIEIAPQTEANSKIKQVFNDESEKAGQQEKSAQNDNANVPKNTSKNGKKEDKPGLDQITFAK